MNPLELFELLFGPSEGCFVTLLDGQSEKVPWRLDLMFDLRWRPKPTWVFQTWNHGVTDKHQMLERDEIYGFLKNQFPDVNWKRRVFNKVKERTLKMLNDMEKAIPKEEKDGLITRGRMIQKVAQK